MSDEMVVTAEGGGDRIKVSFEKAGLPKVTYVIDSKAEVLEYPDNRWPEQFDLRRDFQTAVSAMSPAFGVQH